jgi:hypothetical protein
MVSATPKHVFVVGCPRSGSTWTTLLLAQHPEVASFQHAKLFDYLIHMQRWYANKAGHSFIVPRGQPAGGLPANGTSVAEQPSAEKPSAHDALRLGDVLPERDFHPLLGQVAEGVLAAVAGAHEGASVVVDKTPENGLLADFILKLLPDAYFLHIVRDPRSVFCSHRSAAASWARWEFPSQPVDGARLWQRDVEASLAIAHKTERYLQVRYEDLQEKGASELSKVFEWLELPADEALCTRAIAATTKEKVRPASTGQLPAGFVRKTSAGGWRDELSLGDTKVLEYLAGDLMRSLGYETITQPGAATALRVWLREAPEPALDFLEKKLRRLGQLLHWRWVGRKLEWPEP